MTEPLADMVDLAFGLHGRAVPRGYRGVLAAALTRALPWLAETPGAAVHRLNVSAGSGGNAGGGGSGAAARGNDEPAGEALLSRRTRLVLRLPRGRVEQAAAALCGTRLALGTHELTVGSAECRELLPIHTLYAHVVADPTPEALDELAFQHHVEAELSARGWPCRAIFGRRVSLDCGALHGAPVMLDGLAPPVAQAVLCRGLGAHALQGCGIFVPHRSAAAVGSG